MYPLVAAGECAGLGGVAFGKADGLHRAHDGLGRSRDRVDEETGVALDPDVVAIKVSEAHAHAAVDLFASLELNIKHFNKHYFHFLKNHAHTACLAAPT